MVATCASVINLAFFLLTLSMFQMFFNINREEFDLVHVYIKVQISQYMMEIMW